MPMPRRPRSRAPLVKHAVHGMLSDTNIWHVMQTQMPVLRAALAHETGRYHPTPLLAEDFFRLLYQYAPQFTEDIAPDYEPHQQALKALADTNEGARLRGLVDGDPTSAALALPSVLPGLIDAVLEFLRQQKEEQEQNGAGDPSDAGAGSGGAGQPSGDPGDGQETPGQGAPGQGSPSVELDFGDGEEADAGDPGDGADADGAAEEGEGDAAEAEAEDGEGDAAEAEAEDGDATEDAPNRFAQLIADARGALRAAFAEAQASVEEMGDAMALLSDFMNDDDPDEAVLEAPRSARGWGKEQGHEHESGNTDKMLRMARLLQNNPKLREILRMCGPLHAFAANVERKRIDTGVEQVVGIKYGNDLARVVASDLRLLAHPTTRKLFHLKFAEKRLMQIRVEGTQLAGKGKIILLLDESGSMGGLPFDWMKAIFFEWLRVARAERRDLLLIHFSGPSQYAVEEYPQGRGGINKIIGSMRMDYGGGTDYMTPLNVALAAISGDRYPKGDVILITDGICRVTSDFIKEWNAARDVKHFRTHGVLVNGGNGSTASLDDFCDRVDRIAPRAIKVGVENDADLLSAMFGG